MDIWNFLSLSVKVAKADYDLEHEAKNFSVRHINGMKSNLEKARKEYAAEYARQKRKS